MTFTKFEGLDKEQKADAIWEWGFFLGRVSDVNQNKVLYALNGYFAQMTIDAKSGLVLEVHGMNRLDEAITEHFSISKNSPFIKTLVY